MQSLRNESAVTLRRVFEDYKSTRNLKASTGKDYEKRLSCVRDWLDLPVHKITKDMIEERHKALSTANGPRGTGYAQANSVMRVLRALLNYASFKYEKDSGDQLIKQNPVVILRQLGAWNQEKRRRTYLKPGDMKAWFEAVQTLSNPTVKDYLIFLLLTGLRRSEGANLKWCHYDDFSETITIIDPKNGQDYELPLCDYLVAMLRRRKASASSVNPYIFPGNIAGSSLHPCFKSYSIVTRRSGIKFCLHDLRRTFLTVADSLNIDIFVIKRMANHKGKKDVTEGYICSNAERLRAPVQSVCDAILKHARVEKC